MNGAAPVEDTFLRPEELREIRSTLFDQGKLAVETLNQDILSLEGELPTEERLRSLKRWAHTLKSDCASVGFPELSRLSHALEDALGSLEAAQRPLAAPQCDLLLHAVDALRLGLDAGAAGSAEPDVEPALRSLAAVSGPRGPLDFALPREARERLEQGRAAGLRAVQARVEFEPGTRARGRLLAGLLERLGIEPLAREPGGPLARAARVDLLGLARDPLPALRERAAGVTEARVRVVEHGAQAAPAEAHSWAELPQREGETLRIDARRVDDVLDLVGEMVTARAQIAAVAAEAEPSLPQELALRLGEAQSLLGRVMQELQRSAMRMRMVPAERVFRRFWRTVRDLARRNGRRALLRVEGETTELDRGILDALAEPLAHLVRNAVDHGLEPPAEREAAGKPPEGRVTLRASREGNQILIEVADDGRGIDAGAVLRAARARGLLAEGAADPPEQDVLQLVFHPGLSTAGEVTETSGRGVGLDVVRSTVEALKGTVQAANLSSGGASFLIRVPLTVAIIQALLFRAGGRHLAVPLTSVVEIARESELQVQRVGARELFRLREAALGLVDLGRLLGLSPAPRGQGYVVVVQSAAGRFGLRVDELAGEHELVIKAVHDRFIRTPLVAGAAVLGGGLLVLILDVPAVYRAALELEAAARA